MSDATTAATSQPQHNAVSDSDNKQDNTVASEAERNDSRVFREQKSVEFYSIGNLFFKCFLDRDFLFFIFLYQYVYATLSLYIK